MNNQRDDVSEAILIFMSVFSFVLLCICPGALIWFFLPPVIGIPAMLLCGACGPLLMWWVDREIYGKEKP